MLSNANWPLLPYQLAWTKRCDVAAPVTAGVGLCSGLLAYRCTDRGPVSSRASVASSPTSRLARGIAPTSRCSAPSG